MSTVIAAERGRELWRGVLRAGALVATIGAVGALGACGERRADDGVEYPRPLGFAPTSGSIEGGRLVFVDVDDASEAAARASRSVTGATVDEVSRGEWSSARTSVTSSPGLTSGKAERSSVTTCS